MDTLQLAIDVLNAEQDAWMTSSDDPARFDIWDALLAAKQRIQAVAIIDTFAAVCRASAAAQPSVAGFSIGKRFIVDNPKDSWNNDVVIIQGLPSVSNRVFVERESDGDTWMYPTTELRPVPHAAPVPATAHCVATVAFAVVTCDRCGGKGTFKCTVCNGEGHMSFSDDGIDRDCYACHGDGRIDCLQCKGSGKMDAPAPRSDVAVPSDGTHTPPIQQLLEAIGARVVAMPTVADMRTAPATVPTAKAVANATIAPSSSNSKESTMVKLTPKRRELLERIKSADGFLSYVNLTSSETTMIKWLEENKLIVFQYDHGYKAMSITPDGEAVLSS